MSFEGLIDYQGADYPVTVKMLDSADHRSGKTGLAASLTIYRKRQGQGYALITPTVSELDATHAPGEYAVTLTASELQSLGEYRLSITAPGADPGSFSWWVTDMPGRVNLMQSTVINISDALLNGPLQYFDPLTGFLQVDAERWEGAALPSIPSAAQNASAVMGSVVDGAGTTVLQALRGVIAVLMGLTSRSGGIRHFRNRANTKDVVSATTNNNGDRTAVTLDLS